MCDINLRKPDDENTAVTSNNTGFILGKLGGGKALHPWDNKDIEGKAGVGMNYLMKSAVIAEAMKGNTVIVIDPAAEYDQLAKYLSANEATIINPHSVNKKE